MQYRYLVQIALDLLGAVALVLCLACGWMFYVFYLKWVTRFENGRYFDPVSEVVYTESGSVFGGISLVFLLVAPALWFAARRVN